MIIIIIFYQLIDISFHPRYILDTPIGYVISNFSSNSRTRNTVRHCFRFAVFPEESRYCMIKTVLKIDGMMCGMCESHMNDVVRKSCSPKKVNSSAKNGETVVIIEAPLDIPYLKQQIKDIGYELVSYTSEPYEKKGFFHFGR